MIGPMAIDSRLLTGDDLLKMPDDGFKYELKRGELIRMAPPGFDHGCYGNNVNLPLAAHVKRDRLGVVVFEVGFKLESDPDTVRAPDVAFVSRERLLAVDSRHGYWVGAPDLAVEVISPGDSAQELREKVAEYLAAGARLVWLVYPRTQTVTVYRANGTVEERTVGQTLDGEDVVPGFSLPVAEVFATEL